MMPVALAGVLWVLATYVAGTAWMTRLGGWKHPASESACAWTALAWVTLGAAFVVVVAIELVDAVRRRP